ncbi:hypothetical protein QTN25_006398 [Entamoeba marina]
MHHSNTSDHQLMLINNIIHSINNAFDENYIEDALNELFTAEDFNDNDTQLPILFETLISNMSQISDIVTYNGQLLAIFFSLFQVV